MGSSEKYLTCGICFEWGVIGLFYTFGIERTSRVHGRTLSLVLKIQSYT